MSYEHSVVFNSSNMGFKSSNLSISANNKTPDLVLKDNLSDNLSDIIIEEPSIRKFEKHKS